MNVSQQAPIQFASIPATQDLTLAHLACDGFSGHLNMKETLEKTRVAISEGLIVVHEILLVSLLVDTDLTPQERKKKLESAFKKIAKDEKDVGSCIKQHIHKAILSETAPIILSTGVM